MAPEDLHECDGGLVPRRHFFQPKKIYIYVWFILIDNITVVRLNFLSPMAPEVFNESNSGLVPRGHYVWNMFIDNTAMGYKRHNIL